MNLPPPSHPRSGWSLLEVLLAAFVLLLLAAIALPAFTKTRDQRQTAECAADRDALATACRRYAIERGGWPARAADLVPDFLPAVPVCPADGDIALGTPLGDPPTCTIHAPPLPSPFDDDPTP
jgi:type II secretory pathway pseudopilin PulG